MHKHLKRVLVFAAGIVFLLVGVAGLFLPFLQGVLFIAIGLLLLSLYSPKLRAWMDRHTRRFPKLHRAVMEVEEWVVKIIGRP